MNSLVLSVDRQYCKHNYFLLTHKYTLYGGNQSGNTTHWTELPGQIIRGPGLKAQGNRRVRPMAPEGEEALVSY